MNNFMQKAVELSIENVEKKGGGPFGAVIVKDGQIFAEGSNSVTINKDPTAHAEVVCIRNACQKLGSFDLSGFDMYTSCYPCPMCYGAIKWARIDNIYYANSKEDAHNIGFSDLDIYTSIIEKSQNLIKIDNSDAIKAFNIWTNKENKTTY
jgi:guanine deaminase